MTATLDKTSFTEIKQDIFISQEPENLPLTTHILKYQNIAFFYQLLKGKFYIPMRREFTDLHEHGENYNPFIAHMLPVGKKITPAYKAMWKKEEENRKATSSWNAQCFTVDTNENYFFWKTYTPGCFGICFHTTIQKLIESIDFTGYELYIGRIRYLPYRIEPVCYDIKEYIFSKIDAYKNENELRIYFLPKTQNNTPSSLLLDIIPEKMIEKLWLSPFMPSHLYSFSRDLINTINPEIAKKIVPLRLIETQNTHP